MNQIQGWLKKLWNQTNGKRFSPNKTRIKATEECPFLEHDDRGHDQRSLVVLSFPVQVYVAKMCGITEINGKKEEEPRTSVRNHKAFKKMGFFLIKYFTQSDNVTIPKSLAQ